MLICIDAGHGLYTAGKRCLKSIDQNETREWTLNSRLAGKLQALLTKYDCTTMRVDDVTGETDVNEYDRAKAANRAKADVYVSIHHNAGIKGGSGGGIVVYIHPNHQAQSEVVQEAAYTKWKSYMERYRKELANAAATMPELVAEAQKMGLTDGSRPRDFVSREECAIMARAAAKV